MKLREANILLFNRYLAMAQSITNQNENIKRVLVMCSHVIHNEMLEDKESRWLGFVQGVLFSEGLLNIDVERDFSRKIFHKVYDELHLGIPQSINLSK